MPLYSLGWTLNYEVFFYGLFALCLLLPRRAAVAAAVAALGGLSLAGALAGPLPLRSPSGPSRSCSNSPWAP